MKWSVRPTVHLSVLTHSLDPFWSYSQRQCLLASSTSNKMVVSRLSPVDIIQCTMLMPHTVTSCHGSDGVSSSWVVWSASCWLPDWMYIGNWNIGYITTTQQQHLITLLHKISYSTFQNHGWNYWWEGPDLPKIWTDPHILHSFLMNRVWLCNRLHQTG